MTQYCYEVSLRSIVQLLGMPTDDLPLLRQLADDQGAVVSDAIKPMEHEERLQRWGRIVTARAYLREVAGARRADPGLDMVSAIASAQDEQGEHLLSSDQVVSHLTELIFAGTDTTANLMAHMVMLFDENPEQLNAVKADPTLWPAAVEEGLRRRTPGIGIFRITKRETEVAGVVIPAGAFVWLALAAADHDESVFADPRRFDIHRANASEHISFGKGRHFCPGSPLTRIEAPIGLRTLYDRIPDLRVVPDQPLDYDPVLAALILKRLQVQWTVA
jgi:cytochrome P450